MIDIKEFLGLFNPDTAAVLYLGYVIIYFLIIILLIVFLYEVPKYLKEISETLQRQTGLMEDERWERRHTSINGEMNSNN